MALTTSVGQLLVNEALPEPLRDHGRVLDKGGLTDLLRRLAEEHPGRYREVSHRLSTLGHRFAQDLGGNTFRPQDIAKSRAGVAARRRVEESLRAVIDDDSLDDRARDEKVVEVLRGEAARQQKEVYEESLADRNPFALQVLSGSRGNRMNLASLRGSDLLYQDHRDRPIPVPVLRSYSEGLSPLEYVAGAYGARKGVIDTKLATQRAGYFGKTLAQVMHRLVVTAHDAPPGPTLRGMPADTDDPDNEGALLAAPAGPYGRDTHLTPRVLRHLRRLGHDRILVRSPAVGGSPEGGVYARDVGVRERGELPGSGEQVGMQAAQAIAEPLSQGMLSSKHSGGVAGAAKSVGGFQYVNNLVQAPKVFPGAATHSEEDGRVGAVEQAPAGGWHVTVNGRSHYVPAGHEVAVKPGDEVEAGDLLSDGLPHPEAVTRLKGVGEGRRYFTEAFRRVMRESGLKGHRRNVELLARGLINHVRLTDEVGGGAPGDVVPYSTFEHTYSPREGYLTLPPGRAKGMYLERPYLHYTVGTKVRPSVARELERFGVSAVDAHDDPPPFEPHFVRGASSLQEDPDWLVRMYGSGLKKSLLDAAHRGSASEERGTSFVPGLARAVDFGRGGAVRTPAPGVKPPDPPDFEKLGGLPGPLGAPLGESSAPAASLAKALGGGGQLGALTEGARPYAPLAPQAPAAAPHPPAASPPAPFAGAAHAVSQVGLAEPLFAGLLRVPRVAASAAAPALRTAGPWLGTVGTVAGALPDLYETARDTWNGQGAARADATAADLRAAATGAHGWATPLHALGQVLGRPASNLNLIARHPEFHPALAPLTLSAPAADLGRQAARGWALDDALRRARGG